VFQNTGAKLKASKHISFVKKYIKLANMVLEKK
jgi:hypothetical protein